LSRDDVYAWRCYYVCIMKRTTVEIDQELLERARRALGQPTMRATIEEALRRVAEGAEAEHASRAQRQRQYLQKLRVRADVRVLASGEMWR
jgi:Arc/MetJ family transcription regulator